jgi:hypothetical protein
MKVLNPIQFYFANNGTKSKLLRYIGLKFDIDLRITNDHYFKFLNQPFEPEMITKLFEGWEKVKDTYYNNNISIYFLATLYLAKGVDIAVVYDDAVFIYPSTLADFESDCRRAGIELVFRKDCAK